MSWRNILLLLLIIGAIHLLVIYGCMYGGSREKKSETAGETVDAGSSILKKIFSGGRSAAAAAAKKNPEPEKVIPWKYGKNGVLPPNLQKQAKMAKSAVIVDLASRQVLWEKNSLQPVAVASLTKLMTALLVVEKLGKASGLELDSKVEMSRSAAAVESRKFNAGDKFTVKDMIRAMMICSANDAATLLSERLSGSSDVFVREMNKRAVEMGLTSAKFNSPSGLPQKGVNSFASAGDILHLCEAVMKYPVIMDACGESYAKLSNGKEIYTTNGLLKYPTKARPYWKKVDGLFGFKTGYTKAAGSCLAFGVRRGGRTVLGCVTGFPSSADRERFCSSLIEWAFQSGQVKN